MDEYGRELSEAWRIRACSEVGVPGDRVSLSSFDTHDWVPAAVPGTILAALVAAGRYEDPYFGMNLRNIPREPFERSWWYRTEIRLSEAQAHETVLLEFDGINYAANIWLNGRQVAAAEDRRGAFRRFQYDVSNLVRHNVNVLAVEVIPPKPGDFTIGFVDWNPPAPDRNMGLFRPVRLRFCNGVSIENLFVQTGLDLATLAEADLTVTADLVNHSNEAIRGILEGCIEGIRFSLNVRLQAHENRTVTFTADEYPQLRVTKPRLWWPHDLGTPELYPLELRFVVGSQVLGCRVGPLRHPRGGGLPDAGRPSRVQGQRPGGAHQGRGLDG